MKEELNKENSKNERRKILATMGIVGVSALAGVALDSSRQAEAAILSGNFQFLTLANLRDLKNPSPAAVYWITDAGREGVFRLEVSDKTSTDNGGTLIVSKQGHRFRRLYDGALNVQWFGAKGDGITDDAPALQRALRTGATTGESVFIPQTKAVYSIASTVRVPLVAGQSLRVESNGATIKPVANLKSSTLWKLSWYDERVFLSFGITGAGKQPSTDVNTAFENNRGTTVIVRGLIIDGQAIPIVDSTIKDGKPNWDVQVGIGLQVSAENVVVEECRFQNIFGYGTRLHGPASAYIANNSFHQVGGRGSTPKLKLDMDAFGDGLYISSIKGDGQMIIRDCTFQGISSLGFRSRIAITFEYGEHVYSSLISNCTFSRYAKSIHIEEKVPSDIKIENCLFRDMNAGIANVINDNGRCVVNNCKFLVTDIDNHDGGSPLFLLNYHSTCAVFFSKCEIHLNTTIATWQTIVGAHLFEGCTFYGYNKNHFFADANAHFSNCRFNGFGGESHTFYSYGGGHEYVVENCDFSGDNIFAAGENLKLTFINSRHHTAGKQLLGSYMTNLGGVFPNLNGECTEHVLAGTALEINAQTCPSPLWRSVGKILAVVSTSAEPFSRTTSDYKKLHLKIDSKGVWTGEKQLPPLNAEAKRYLVVLVPVHYEQYL